MEVLILVLVEDGLGDTMKKLTLTKSGEGLNPCFSGGWSRSFLIFSLKLRKFFVLILVLVEDGLGE